MDNSFRLLLFSAALVLGLAQQTDAPNRPSISIHGEALIGRNMTLTCIDPVSSTKSPLSASYQWIKNNSVIPGKHSRQIVFGNVSLADEGDYTCRYKLNGSVTLSPSSNTFSVSFKIPPQVYIEEANGPVYRIPEGRNLLLTCSLLNTPNPSVATMAFSWTFRPGNANESTTSGQEVNLTDPKQKWGDSTHSTGHVLTVGYVNRSHSGRYTCHATNDPDNTVGLPSANASIQVQIQHINNETVIITSEMPQPVVAGDKVTLKCQAYTTSNLTWLHQGFILRTVESKEDDYSFPATGCQDSGEYQCRADNEAIIKPVYGGINVTVECPPTPTGLGNVSELAEMAGKEGERLTLSVSARGTPPPVYTWSGPRLPPVTQSGNLELWNLQPSDAGIYTVNVSNKHGSFLQKFNVVVQAIAGAGGVDPNIWMTVCGVIFIVLLIICIVLFVLQKRKFRMKRRPDRPPETRREARREEEPSVAKQHRRRGRRPRMDSSWHPPKCYHGNRPNTGGQRGTRARVARFLAWERPGDDKEATPFMPSPTSDPVDSSTSDPVDPTARDPLDTLPPVPAAPFKEDASPPRPPPVSALAGIPFHIYPWAFLQRAESSDSTDECEDNYGLSKGFRPKNGGKQPDPEGHPLPKPEEGAPVSKNLADTLYLEDEKERLYGVIDVFRWRRQRPSSLARFGVKTSPSRSKTPAPPKPNLCTVPTLKEVMEEEEVNLDVVPKAPSL